MVSRQLTHLSSRYSCSVESVYQKSMFSHLLATTTQLKFSQTFKE